MNRRKTTKGLFPLAVKAEKALREAVADAIRDHRRTGDPVAIWKNGRAVFVSADKVRVPSVRS